MNSYISILRGINVTGHRPVKMQALRQMYESLGFTNVRSYVQSGNVLFRSDRSNTGEMAGMIAEGIRGTFGHEVSVIVLTPDRLKKIILRNPFANAPGKEPAFMHVTFLSTKPDDPDHSSIDARKSGNEEIHYTDEAVYLYCPNGYGKSKLSNNLIESRLKVSATTRNWKTTNKLLEMVSPGEKPPEV